MDGVTLTLLKQIHHPKGEILHAMKKSDEGFNGFGEAYFSIVNEGEIKGWKKHTKMTLNLIVPVGEIKFVIFNEETNEFFDVILSLENYQRLTITPGLWFAFQGLGKGSNMVLNIANIEHDPNEVVSKDLKEINYEW